MSDERIAKLESTMEEIKTSMASIEMRLGLIEGSLAETKSRLYRLPSGWRLLGVILAATLVTWGICTIMAFAFVIAVEGDMR
ncbi:hypothetical protein [Microvirga sp. VF16]|uniref:hypothetical protein n=1 Tax=Microvirga sp. VF16 TaxID=2807101 RepID=UPI00193E5F2D|nr:hypothetical protein [Microvirga sp. VF16]QRM28888.1 hypothetical protein JO965_22220 [Microvirga sp. VF16]